MTALHSPVRRPLPGRAHFNVWLMTDERPRRRGHGRGPAACTAPPASAAPPSGRAGAPAAAISAPRS